LHQPWTLTDYGEVATLDILFRSRPHWKLERRGCKKSDWFVRGRVGMLMFEILETLEHLRHHFDEALKELRWSLAMRQFDQAQC
jgi:hypothetical protein